MTKQVDGTIRYWRWMAVAIWDRTSSDLLRVSIKHERRSHSLHAHTHTDIYIYKHTKAFANAPHRERRPATLPHTVHSRKYTLLPSGRRLERSKAGGGSKNQREQRLFCSSKPTIWAMESFDLWGKRLGCNVATKTSSSR